MLVTPARPSFVTRVPSFLQTTRQGMPDTPAWSIKVSFLSLKPIWPRRSWSMVVSTALLIVTNIMMIFCLSVFSCLHAYHIFAWGCWQQLSYALQPSSRHETPTYHWNVESLCSRSNEGWLGFHYLHVGGHVLSRAIRRNKDNLDSLSFLTNTCLIFIFMRSLVTS